VDREQDRVEGEDYAKDERQDFRFHDTVAP